MDKSLLFIELKNALGNGYSETEIAEYVSLISKAVNDNDADDKPVSTVGYYHSRAVDTAMNDGGWKVMHSENRMGNFANDNHLDQHAKHKLESLLGRCL